MELLIRIRYAQHRTGYIYQQTASFRLSKSTLKFHQKVTQCTGVTHSRIEVLVSERRREKNFHKISLLLGKTLEESFFLRPLL